MEGITVGVLTISDRCWRGEARDESGEVLAGLLGGKVERGLVPDEQGAIESVLKDWCDVKRFGVVLTTGGTGLSERDVTPEATRAVLDKETPGISLLIANKSLEKTRMAALSRAAAGVRGKTLIVNFPGSKRAVTECYEAVAPVLPHAVDLIRGEVRRVAAEHGEGVESRVDAGRIADRARESRHTLWSVQDAQECTVKVAGDIPWREKIVDVADALGFVLAEDVVAADPLPPFPASVKDGYAVVAADGAGRRAVVGASSAGDESSMVVQRGTCVRVNTGARVPRGTDAVVQVEDTVLLCASQDRTEELEIEIRSVPSQGQDIRAVGSDVKEGELVLARGCLLGACELGVLATVGRSQVRVLDKPVVGVLSTGNELVEAGQSGVGRIRDSNRPTLLALLRGEGFPVLDLGIARDTPRDLLRALLAGLPAADVLLTTGSVSMGERDYLKEVLAVDLGATLHFGRVQMKPGKPTSFASFPFESRSRLWFGLPGNPVSAAVTFHLFVLPALRRLRGTPFPSCLPHSLPVTLSAPLTLDTRPEYRRAYLSPSLVASVTGNQVSSRLLSCVGADCLLQLPASLPEQTALPQGASVLALPLRKY